MDPNRLTELFQFIEMYPSRSDIIKLLPLLSGKQCITFNDFDRVRRAFLKMTDEKLENDKKKNVSFVAEFGEIRFSENVFKKAIVEDVSSLADKANPFSESLKMDIVEKTTDTDSLSSGRGSFVTNDTLRTNENPFSNSDYSTAFDCSSPIRKPMRGKRRIKLKNFMKFCRKIKNM